MPATTGKSRPLPALGITKILVPLDFSECSQKALEYALPFARQFHAGITLLHVVHLNYYAASSEYTASDFPALIDEARRDGEKQLAPVVRAIRKKCPVKAILETGHPGNVIVDSAKKLGIDLIIISTHGRTGLKRAFLGSTTEHVVRHAPCPVLTVREHEHEFIRRRQLGRKKDKP